MYCAIGQCASAVAKAVAVLRERGALEYSVVVVTEGNDPPGLVYIASYAATSIAESVMEAGRDVLIVYDDLTHHARAYRELSLLLRRPPGVSDRDRTGIIEGMGGNGKSGASAERTAA